MNIFVLDQDPIKAAKQLCNKHSSRMPLETAGMLSFAFPEGETIIKNERKNRHYSHPASIWARESLENFEWLLLHGLSQCEEYTKRYKRTHDSQFFIEWAEKNYKYLNFTKKQQTPFARCFGQFKELLNLEVPSTLDAYRKFYWLDKKEFAKWPSLKDIPDWWIEKNNNFLDKNFKNGVYMKR